MYIEGNIRGAKAMDVYVTIEDLLSLEATDGSDATIYVTTNLDLTAKGGCDVTVKGNPSNKKLDASNDSDIRYR